MTDGNAHSRLLKRLLVNNCHPPPQCRLKPDASQARQRHAISIVDAEHDNKQSQHREATDFGVSGDCSEDTLDSKTFIEANICTSIHIAETRRTIHNAYSGTPPSAAKQI